MDAYNAELMDYWKAIGRPDGQPWTINTANRYRQVYFPNTRLAALKQGFKFDK